MKMQDVNLWKLNIRIKSALRNTSKEHNGIDVDPRSIFDIQVKRLHEYKTSAVKYPAYHVSVQSDQRASGDVLLPKNIYLRSKGSSRIPRAKETIKLINSVADVVNNDRSINGKLKVVFIEDYRVSNAEILFAAADVSEQISTASKRGIRYR